MDLVNETVEKLRTGAKNRRPADSLDSFLVDAADDRVIAYQSARKRHVRSFREAIMPEVLNGLAHVVREIDGCGRATAHMVAARDWVELHFAPGVGPAQRTLRITGTTSKRSLKHRVRFEEAPCGCCGEGFVRTLKANGGLCTAQIIATINEWMLEVVDATS